MRCLIVGAGAIGQVFGYHLHRGGARVCYLVKPEHAAAARLGFTLYPLNRKRARETPVSFTEFEVITHAGEAAAPAWDCVLLCVSSTALRAGDWLDELVTATGAATIVTIQPGVDDYELVTTCVPAEQVVSGMVGMTSYAAPLAGERVPRPGTAYWWPPGGGCPFDGAPARVRPLVAAFRRGGLPARVQRDVRRATGFSTALLQTQIAALECAGWSIRALHRDRRLRATAHRAMREASAAVAAHDGASVPFAHKLLRPTHLTLLLSAAARLAPMDLERFFEVHYTKVRAQSLELLTRWIDLAHDAGQQAPALRELHLRLTTEVTA